MRKMVIDRKRVRTASGKKLTLIYSVTVDELSGESLTPGVESYGACVSVRENGEEEAVRSITLSCGEILSLTALLARGCVTPSTLRDVVYDWLCRD